MRVWTVILVSVLLMAGSAQANEPARQGSALADVFAAFAPLLVLWTEYFEFSFQGSTMGIPVGLPDACEQTSRRMGYLHIEWMTQTSSETLQDAWHEIAWFRSDLSAFCDTHEDALRHLSSAVPDDDLIRQAAGQGLFVDIRRLQNGLHSVLDAMLNSYDKEDDRWYFGVAFALRGVLAQQRLQRLGSELQHILHGAEDADAPPPFVSPTTRQLIDELIAWLAIPLDDRAAETVRCLAGRLYEAVMDTP